MGLDNRWLLPEGIEEVIPPRAANLESLRRGLVDMYACWGYELIMPPMVEFADSLLTGSAGDLDLDTIKFVDQVSGRMMGMRADMTQQAARIDAHHFNTQSPVRLCYLGTVLHARPNAFGGTRSPLQVGCELYGHCGAASDLEMLSLLVETLGKTGISSFYIDLGHVGIFRGLARTANLTDRQEAVLFDALQRKARPEMEAFCADNLDADMGAMFLALIDLNGDASVLEEARTKLSRAGDDALAAIDDLSKLAALIDAELPKVKFHYDLAELRGYQYQTGVVFAALVPGHGQEVARGGRYNEIGKVFGRARPATGFSADLKTLLLLGELQTQTPAMGIFAPSELDADLKNKITELRAGGEKVVRCLPKQQGDAAAMGCDRVLVKTTGGWQVEPA